MLRFRVKDDTTRHTHRHSRRSKTKKTNIVHRDEDGSEYEVDSEQYIDVDVGTPSRLRVTLDDAIAFRCIHTSSYSKLFQIQRTGGGSEVLVVRWMDPSCSSSDKDDVAISMVPDQSIVPTYEGKVKYMHQGTYVSVGIRKYIDGQPLSKIMKKITPAELDHYKLQVSSIITELSAVVSDHYGCILDGNLKTSSVPSYISAHNMVEKLRNSHYIGSPVIATEDNWDHNCKPRMCHGAMWPEHIIVKGTSVEGIVGWSSADFVPESVDRYIYMLWHVQGTRDQDWRRFLSFVPTVDSAARTFIAQCEMIRYAQAISMSRAGRSGAKSVERAAERILRDTVETDPLWMRPNKLSTRSSVAESVSDAGSLATLTDETIDTWEQFTVTTENTAKQ
jgi:hypothetical protein